MTNIENIYDRNRNILLNLSRHKDFTVLGQHYSLISFDKYVQNTNMSTKTKDTGTSIKVGGIEIYSAECYIRVYFCPKCRSNPEQPISIWSDKFYSFNEFFFFEESHDTSFSQFNSIKCKKCGHELFIPQQLGIFPKNLCSIVNYIAYSNIEYPKKYFEHIFSKKKLFVI